MNSAADWPDVGALQVHGDGVATCRLTVITPVLNGRRFIERCVRSVASQRFVELEHLVVDGGSHDGTVELLGRLAAELPHLRWLSASDTGQSEAMNRGIRLARGRLIGFLNVDDFYEPGVLPRVLALAGNVPEPALLVGNCRLLDEDGAMFALNRPSRLTLKDLLVRDPFNPNFPANPSGYFYHRSLHDLVGPYDPEEHYAMDAAFLLRAVQRATVIRVDDVWGNFVVHRDSKTARDNTAGTGWARYRAIARQHHASLSLDDRLFVEWKSLGAWPRRAWSRLRFEAARLKGLVKRVASHHA
jgi:glycosyltransferase involved in cell wall biosynthesis